MRHFDTFSGYGGFSLPAREMGWQTIGFSEIDKYASAVLAYNFEGIPNYGDISKIDFRQFDGKVDLITGGTPCQDLSVAGKQAGLSGARSGLFFEFIRAITESQPQYFIWENVKGSLSSSQGWDMARVQIEMAEAGYSIEWRVLNATEFSVPQNRERIFILGTRGEGGREILPKPEGAGQALKELTQGMSQGNRVYDPEGSATAQVSQAGGLGAKTGLYAVEPNSNGNAHAIDSNYWKGTNTLDKSRRSQVIEPRTVVYDDYNSKVRTDGNVGSITRNIGNPAMRNGTKLIEPRAVARGRSDDPWKFTDTAPDGYRIRRLTPTECERLMGLPDGWTSKGIIDGQEVDISDTQRYKMCGNGVVTNVVKSIYENL